MMQSLGDRPYEQWDKGDHVSFALAGLIAVAGRAAHQGLSPGPRGWVDGYPEKLADDLEFWVRKIRAADVNQGDNSRENIVDLDVPTKADIPTERITRNAVGCEFKQVVVIGTEPDDTFYFASSQGSDAETNYLLQKGIQYLHQVRD